MAEAFPNIEMEVDPELQLPEIDTSEFMGFTYEENCVFEEDKLQWINIKLLEPILQNEMNNIKLHINQIERSPAIKSNENYGTIPCLAKVTIKRRVEDPDTEKQELKLFIKYITPNNNKINSSILEIYRRERKLYEVGWPQIKDILTEVPDNNLKGIITARYYKGSPEHTVILDHLSQYGFINKDRSKRVNVDHSRQVMRALGRIHASSIIVNRNRTVDFEYGFTSLFIDLEKSQFLRQFYKNTLTAFAYELKTWKGYNQYEKDVLNLSDQAAKLIYKFRSSKFGKVQGLIHGECWSNNLLFHYPENSFEPDEIALVDFQMCQWGCTALDLQHYLFVSTNLDVISNHIDNLIQIYIESFHNVFNMMGYPVDEFTKENFMSDFNDTFLYGVIFAFTHQVLAQQTDDCVIDIATLINGECLKKDSAWRALLREDRVTYFIKLIFDRMEKLHLNFKNI